MVGFLVGAAVFAAALFGFSFARQYTLKRLRFVDGIRNPVWPWAVGLVAALVAAPVAWILPFVGTGSAILFGAATALGSASGVKALRRGGE